MVEVVKPICHGHMPPYEKRGVACATCPAPLFESCGLETMKDVFGKRGIPVEKVKVLKP